MKLLLRLLIGALGGMSATGPMTILMEFLHRRLAWLERYPLPPREVTEAVADKAGMRTELEARPEAKAALVLVNHFAYGGAVGVIYSAVFGHAPRQGLAKGAAFGVCVWVASYFGLLPAASLLRPAQEHPARRNGLMLLVHIAWGALLGAFVEMVETERMLDGGALVKGATRPITDDKARE